MKLSCLSVIENEGGLIVALSPPRSPGVVMTPHHIDGQHSTCSTEYRTRPRRTGGPAVAKEATSVRSALEPVRYEIRVKGQLADRWAAWFDGMTLTRRADGTTVLDGPVADQSALHGLLRKVSDLGLPLVSLIPIPGMRSTTTTETT
jgi:hypothetical protein